MVIKNKQSLLTTNMLEQNTNFKLQHSKVMHLFMILADSKSVPRFMLHCFCCFVPLGFEFLILMILAGDKLKYVGVRPNDTGGLQIKICGC